MRHLTSDLKGRLLDAAVHLCELAADLEPSRAYARVAECTRHDTTPHFSSWWAHGGPLIERESINLVASVSADEDRVPLWFASVGRAEQAALDAPLPLSSGTWSTGSAPLMAAMRAYVNVKLGTSVDLP